MGDGRYLKENAVAFLQGKRVQCGDVLMRSRLESDIVHQQGPGPGKHDEDGAGGVFDSSKRAHGRPGFLVFGPDSPVLISILLMEAL